MLKSLYLIASSLTFILLLFNIPVNNNNIKFETYDKDVVNSVKIYRLIEKYSKEYKIPKHIMFNMAFKETSYRGPFNYNYNHSRTSSTGAVGPMQILPSTASYVNGYDIDKEELKNNLNLNIETSAKYLNMLYKRFKNWNIVCGYYNTGYRRTNDYSNYCVNNKNYTKIWVKQSNF
jgi:soluble lytic murein transglycosylase-like protein